MSDLMEWLPLAEIARRLPSPQPGKRTHVTTVYRLAVKHKLEVLRRGRYRFLRWADVLRIFTKAVPFDPISAAEAERSREELRAKLRAAGVLK